MSIFLSVSGPCASKYFWTVEVSLSHRMCPCFCRYLGQVLKNIFRQLCSVYMTVCVHFLSVSGLCTSRYFWTVEVSLSDRRCPCFLSVSGLRASKMHGVLNMDTLVLRDQHTAISSVKDSGCHQKDFLLADWDG